MIQSWIRKPTTAAGTKEIARLRKNRRLAGSVLAEAAASQQPYAVKPDDRQDGAELDEDVEGLAPVRRSGPAIRRRR